MGSVRKSERLTLEQQEKGIALYLALPKGRGQRKDNGAVEALAIRFGVSGSYFKGLIERRKKEARRAKGN